MFLTRKNIGLSLLYLANDRNLDIILWKMYINGGMFHEFNPIIMITDEMFENI